MTYHRQMLTHFGITLGALVVLDTLWLGFLMNGFYKNQLAPIARMGDGKMTPNWPAAALVYLCLAMGITVLVLGRARSPLEALMLGAFFGLVVYGTYDFTNYSTLRDYPLALAVVDLAWGTVICGGSAWITATLSRVS